MRGDEVCGVDDGAGEVLWQSCVDEPGTTGWADVDEGGALDEGEGCVEIGDSGFAGDEGAGSEAFEEVGVDLFQLKCRISRL